MTDMVSAKLRTVASEVRREILAMAYRAQSAHTGGALSVVEILVALYFGGVLRIDPKKPDDNKRDRLVFSKAHDAKALYAVLALRGFFPKKLLVGYELDGGRLHGHNVRGSVPGIEVSTGSLGHGLPMGVGIAFAVQKNVYGSTNHKFRTINPSPRVFVIMSDGECQEGTTWEAALLASQHKLDNLVVIVDYNKLQGFGFVKEVADLEPFADKWRSFGWAAREIDGHDLDEMIAVCRQLPFKKGKPSVIIAHTIKGKGGVDKHVGQVSSQYKPPTKEEFEKLIKQQRVLPRSFP